MAETIANINGYAYSGDRNAAAAVFGNGAAILAKYLAQLDGANSYQALSEWLACIEENVLVELDHKSAGYTARFLQWKAEHARVKVCDAVRDECGRLVRTFTREVTAREAAALGT